MNAAGAYAQVTEDAQGNFVCPTDYVKMPLLCPFLSKTSNVQGDNSISSFHGPIDKDLWTNAITGHLELNDNPSTTWDIDLHVPCFAGQCGQDWAGYVLKANPDADPNAYLINPNLKGQQLGCDLWYELTAVNRDN